jgi:hypothetical protein
MNINKKPHFTLKIIANRFWVELFDLNIMKSIEDPGRAYPKLKRGGDFLPVV